MRFQLLTCIAVLGQLGCALAAPLGASPLQRRGLSFPKPQCIGNCLFTLKTKMVAATKGPQEYHMQSAKLGWWQEKKQLTDPRRAANYGVSAAMHKHQANIAGDASWYRYLADRKYRKVQPEEFDDAIQLSQKRAANPKMSPYKQEYHAGIVDRLTRLRKGAREPGPLEWKRPPTPIQVVKIIPKGSQPVTTP